MFTCNEDPENAACRKKKVNSPKSTEAQEWLNMMASMLNFAMASTTLMKSIQNRVEITRKLEEEARAMHAAEYFKQEFSKSLKDNDMTSEDFSLRTDPIRKDDCTDHACGMTFKNKELDQCDPGCVGKKSSSLKKKPPCSKKKKRCQESDETLTLGGSCLCLIPVEEQHSEIKEDCSCIQIKECVKDLKDDELSCVCFDGEDKEEVNKPTVDIECVCPSTPKEPDKSEPPKDDEKPSEGQDNGETEEKKISCGCQTTPSEDLMLKELQMANLTYQMRQTDKNLKELKREMDRLNNVMVGKKKCTFATAAALYEEIMKPTKLLDEVPKFNCRKNKFP